MEIDKKIDILVKIGTQLLTLATVTIGVWQFNKGQNELKVREIAQRKFELTMLNNRATIETLSKFKELQNKLYIETTSVISYLTVNENHDSPLYKEKLERFWQLYWVELSSVETPEVETAMVHFGDVLKKVQNDKFVDNQGELKKASYEVAQAIKKSASTWVLPEELKK